MATGPNIPQPPAPFHAKPRGFIGFHLPATILLDKFGMHSPLNRYLASPQLAFTKRRRDLDLD